MRQAIIVFVVVFAAILSACSSEETNNDALKQQEGLIAEKNEDHILVIPNLKKEDIDNKRNEELVMMASEKEGAYYEVEAEQLKELEKGIRVLLYWNGEQEDSDPPIRQAEKIETLQ
ncbi:DUF3221 domain-containing protein [Jeotgalibacillus sp. ET6]|uniref:DUF3221 domain-containing protein n=1 Tax=Jeotgalibacillus sp. ET6 TaxID=3037260 RepID=UPI00241824E8|nr:DUF3221 domain-containing protein [Jeotgalibacillus sp. ET6]MDG5473206.1 DUF3221 domain-containing protein [Jeotgalibacillus sp. ET6]